MKDAVKPAAIIEVEWFMDPEFIDHEPVDIEYYGDRLENDDTLKRRTGRIIGLFPDGKCLVEEHGTRILRSYFPDCLRRIDG